jgi:hypothetical protein
MEEVEPVKTAVTCRTEGCPVEGETFVLDVYPVGDPPVATVICVRCNQRVTDLVPVQ